MPTPVGLGVIIAILTVVVVASLVKIRNDPTAKAHAGSLRGHRDERPDRAAAHQVVHLGIDRSSSDFPAQVKAV